jgi:hypothetical protein
VLIFELSLSMITYHSSRLSGSPKSVAIEGRPTVKRPPLILPTNVMPVSVAMRITARALDNCKFWFAELPSPGSFSWAKRRWVRESREIWDDNRSVDAWRESSTSMGKIGLWVSTVVAIVPKLVIYSLLLRRLITCRRSISEFAQVTVLEWGMGNGPGN